MVRIGVSVEGLTEERFIKAVLYPYLLPKKISIIPIPINGSVNLDKVRNELRKMANNFDYVTTLYDFYGFRNKNISETKESLESKILDTAHKRVKPKLMPYIQMYEYEGLLFSCPASIENILNESGIRDWAENILRKFQNNPEAINNSTETAPSKRLIAKTNYLKTTHGPNIAAEIGVDKIRKMCKGFDNWVSQIESKNS